MAKHPHKILLINNKTWKCVLGGCAFFVHVGLQHVLLGKHAECWGCEETFEIDDSALKDAKPKCVDCRLSGLSEEDTPSAATESGRTPEQEKAYDKEMTQMFGKNWRALRDGKL